MGEKNNKILLIMPRIYYGGAETQFRYFAEYCNKHNVEMYMAVENKDGNREDIEKFKELNKNIKFIEYKNSSAGYTTSNFFMKNIRKIKGLFNLLFKTFFICVRFKDISTVIVYDGFGLKLTSLFKLFGKKVIYSERNSGKETLGSFFNKFNLKKADIVCANSLPAKKYIENNSDIKVQLIYNGIKVKDTVETKQKSEGEFNILVPGRIIKRKNVKAIIESLTFLDCKYKVWLCGDIREYDYYNEIKEYIEEHKLENIVFTGQINNISEYYKKADLVILASFSEGMPNVILESFANKRMIISSDIEMNRAIMKDEKFVFNPNSPSELAEKIKMVMNMSEAEKNATVEKNFEYVKDNFSIDKMANSYLNLVKGLENKNE